MHHYKDIVNHISNKEYPTVKNNKGTTYYNIAVSFDIETTSIQNGEDKVAFMYVWAIDFDDVTYWGRDWYDFIDLCNILAELLELDATGDNKKLLVIYVHNLGYEFQFMRKYFYWDNVFSISERKPIKAVCEYGIEFRDSYILSGYSLANTAKNLTTHKIEKLTGDLDYSLTRHTKTELTEKEWQYLINDVKIVTAYINEQIAYYKGIDKIPMTNTGRVRKYTRDYCYYKTESGEKAGKGHYTRYRKIMDDLTLTPKSYSMLKRAFMGGFTHANANYTNKVLNDVSSIDFTSSYPSVMLSEKFPMSKYIPIDIKDTEQFDDLCERKSVIFNAIFINLRSKITQEVYISEHKARHIKKAIVNNGRIQQAESLEITLTEVDLDIINNCYEYDDLKISDVMYAHKGYLPKPIIISILNLYQDKTELKDVEGYETEYLLSKGMLNSVYGMCVTDVVKDNAVYNSIDNNWVMDKVDAIEEIEKYNDSKNRFLYYAWGVYVTAYARRNLWTGILATGDDYIYSDTDSLKILNYDDHKEYIEWFNETIVDKMKLMCVSYDLDVNLLEPKTKKGVSKMMGVWDFEGTYNQFKTLGAKRYLVERDGKLQLTVAGLSKQNGINYMLQQCGGDINKVFDMFSDSLHIPRTDTGKNTHSYIDIEMDIHVTDYQGNGLDMKILSGIHLETCDFTLSLSDQYMDFLTKLSNGYMYKGVKFL